MQSQKQSLVLKPKLTLWLVGYFLAILFSIFFSRKVINVIGFTVFFLLILYILRFKTKLILTDQSIFSERLLQKTKILLKQITKVDISWKTYGKDFRNNSFFTRSQVTVEAPGQKINIGAFIFSEEQIISFLKTLYQTLEEKYPSKVVVFSAKAQKAMSRYPII